MNDLIFRFLLEATEQFDPLGKLLLWHAVQVTIVGLIVWPLARIASKRNAYVAHLLWALVLIKCVTPPLIAAPTSPFCWLGGERVPSSLGIVVSAVEPIELASIERTHFPKHEKIALPPNPKFENKSAEVYRAATIEEKQPQKNEPKIAGGPNFHSVPSQAVSLAPPPSVSNYRIFTTVLLSIWLTGVVVVFLKTGWRMRLLGIEIKGSKPSEELTQLACSIAERLQGTGRTLAKHRVRVAVMSSETGPAITGLFRPTILLPQSLVDSLYVAEDSGDRDLRLLEAPATELEPVIAHELMHFRRGDLWWAALQSLCLCIFWFHPLVRLAVRELTLQSERCCDEQTIAGLGCSPDHYAKGLLHVLEHKVRLRAVAALPGVRTIDITSNRLERIMNFKDEMKSSTPALAWVVLLVGGLITLPGATWVVAQSALSKDVSDDTIVRPRAIAPIFTDTIDGEQIAYGFSGKDDEDRKPKSVNETLDDRLNQTPLEVRAYEVSKVKAQSLKALKEEGIHTTETHACQILCPLVAYRGFRKTVTEEIAKHLDIQERRGLPAKVALGGDQPMAKILGDYLFLLAPKEHHEITETTLELYEKYGFEQLITRASFAAATRDQLEHQEFTWKLALTRAGMQDKLNQFTLLPKTHPLWLPMTEMSNDDYGSQTDVRHTSPIFLAEIDQQQLQQFTGILQRDATSQFTRLPTVTTFNGQTAKLQEKNEMHPFVTGLVKKENGENFAPFIELFHVGTSLETQGVCVGDESVDLAFDLSHTQTVRVDTQKTLLKSEQGDPYSVQIPHRKTMELRLKHRFPKGRTLVVATPFEANPERFRVMIISCERISQKPVLETNAPHKNLVAPKGEPNREVQRASFEEKLHPFDLPAQPKLQKLMISSSVKTEDAEPDSWAAKTLLRELGFDAEINGHWDIKLDSHNVVLTGNDVSVEIRGEKLSAEKGVLKFTDKRLASVELIGKATKFVNGFLPFKADRAILKTGSAPSEFSKVFDEIKMTGNVVSEIREPGEVILFSAHEVTLNSTEIVFKGDTQFEIAIENFKTTGSMDSGSMNHDLESLKLSGNVSLTLAKGALKQTWESDEITYQRDSGLTVDGKTFNIEKYFSDEE